MFHHEDDKRDHGKEADHGEEADDGASVQLNGLELVPDIPGDNGLSEHLVSRVDTIPRKAVF